MYIFIYVLYIFFHISSPCSQKDETGSGSRGGIGQSSISHRQELGALGENGQMMESYNKLKADHDEWKRKFDEGQKQMSKLDQEIKDLKAHIANYCSEPYPENNKKNPS